MSTQEYREMAQQELTQKLDDLQQEMFNLRFQLSTRQINDTSRVRQVRREIARVKTLLHERELMAEEQ
jgi:large subunit ribosomal protein L29